MRCPKEALRSSYIPDMTRVLGVYCFTNSSLFSCCLSRHPQAPAPYSPWSTNAQYSLTEWRCPKYLTITIRSIHVVVARLNSYDAELRLSQNANILANPGTGQNKHADCYTVTTYYYC